MLSRLYAGWLLGWSLVKTLARRLFAPGARGLAAFRRNFAADRLLPVSTTERALLPAISGCIGCGRCDDGQEERIVQSAGAYRGMMAFVLSASRSMPDFDAAARIVAGLDDKQLDDMQRRCPADIQFRSMVAFVRSHASQLRPVR